MGFFVNTLIFSKICLIVGHRNKLVLNWSTAPYRELGQTGMSGLWIYYENQA